MPILGSEASAICWYWTCRCLVGVGSICNLLDLDLQMPDRGWKHLQFAGFGFADTYRGEFRMWKYLQFAGIGFADAWSGLEVSATCWIWICRCLVGVGSICNLLVLNLQMPVLGSEVSATCWIWICRCLVGGRKYLQFAGIGFADTYPGFGSICNLLELDL